MPGTARSYGLRKPFDAGRGIDAQGHLMSDLLSAVRERLARARGLQRRRRGGVKYSGVPPYPETRAYVAQILGMLGGAGELPMVGGFEVRLVK